MVGIDRKIDRCKARYKDRWVVRNTDKQKDRQSNIKNEIYTGWSKKKFMM